MKTSTPRFPNLTRSSFARTNSQTIVQRVGLLREFVPGARAITEICCGDCSRQHQAYTSELSLQTFRGLDLEPTIVAANQAKGIECHQGDALDSKALPWAILPSCIMRFAQLGLMSTCD